MDYLKDQPAFVGVNSDLDAAMPSIQVAIDRDRAAALGVPPPQIETALGDAFGGRQISQINRPSNQYEVMLELLPQYQAHARVLRPALCHQPVGHLGAAVGGDHDDAEHHAAQQSIIPARCRP